jgi:hypothetical protein
MELRFYRRELVEMTNANNELRDALRSRGVNVDDDATPAELARLAAETLAKPQAQRIGLGDSPLSAEQRLEDLLAAASEDGIGNPTEDVVRELDLVRHPSGPRFVTRSRAEALVGEQQGANS